MKKSTKDKKSEHVNIRMKVAEKKRLRELCSKLDRTESDLLRMAFNEHFKTGLGATGDE